MYPLLKSPSFDGTPVSKTNYQPISFSKEVFNQNTFKVDSFLSDCRRRGIPLENVLNELRDYTSALDTELLELINKDYTDFVNLSSKLVGIDKIINDIRSPLKVIQQEVLVSYIP
jgi:hypothetical protein